MVPNISGSSGQKSNTVTAFTESVDTTIQHETAPTAAETDNVSRSLIRKVCRKYELSSKATAIIMHAWKSGTHKQYAVYTRKWTQFCAERKTDCINPNVGVVLEFLTQLFEQGLSYSAINCPRSALSQFIIWKKHQSIGSHPWIIRFMKGVYNLRPPVPRYIDTWDVEALLRVLRSLSPVSKLSLRNLTLKTVTLVALVLAARSQTITLLNLKNMTRRTSKYCFVIGAAELKQSRPGYTPPLIELKAYAVDKALCVYRALDEYLSRTEAIRGSENSLFISYVKPHGKVTSTTIARWVKTMMARAGIDITVYKAHSIRAASTSKAWKAGEPLQEILATEGWSSKNTFARYYNKNIRKPKQMAQKVLNTQL